MPHHIPWSVSVTPHSGSSAHDILHEPDWANRSAHCIGYKNRDSFRTGIIHSDHDHDVDYRDDPGYAAEVDEAIRKRAELQRRIDAGIWSTFEM